MSKGGRAFSRAVAQLLLLASFFCWFFTCLGTPTIKNLAFLTADFPDGTHLKLGPYGYCAPGGCPHTTIGYKVDQSLLPPAKYDPFPEYPQYNQIMNYKLVGTLILLAFCAGQHSLALLASLVPTRTFGLIAIFFTFLGWGLGFIIMVCALIAFTGAADRIRDLYGSGYVNPSLANDMWLLLSAEALSLGAFVMLFPAIEPRPKRGFSNKGETTGLVAF